MGLDLESFDPSGFFRDENADGAGLAAPESRFTLDPRAEFNGVELGSEGGETVEPSLAAVDRHFPCPGFQAGLDGSDF